LTLQQISTTIQLNFEGYYLVTWNGLPWGKI